MPPRRNAGEKYHPCLFMLNPAEARPRFRHANQTPTLSEQTNHGSITLCSTLTGGVQRRPHKPFSEGRRLGRTCRCHDDLLSVSPACSHFHREALLRPAHTLVSAPPSKVNRLWGKTNLPHLILDTKTNTGTPGAGHRKRNVGRISGV